MRSLMVVLEWLKKSLVLSLLLTQKHCGAKAVYMAKHWKAYKWQMWECHQGISKCKHASLLKKTHIAKGKKESEAQVLLSLIPVLWGATKSLGCISLRGLVAQLGSPQHLLPQPRQGWLCKPAPSCPHTHMQLGAWTGTPGAGILAKNWTLDVNPHPQGHSLGLQQGQMGDV